MNPSTSEQFERFAPDHLYTGDRSENRVLRSTPANEIRPKKAGLFECGTGISCGGWALWHKAMTVCWMIRSCFYKTIVGWVHQTALWFSAYRWILIRSTVQYKQKCWYSFSPYFWMQSSCFLLNILIPSIHQRRSACHIEFNYQCAVFHCFDNYISSACFSLYDLLDWPSAWGLGEKSISHRASYDRFCSPCS